MHDDVVIKTAIFFCCPCFFFVFIILVTIADAFYGVPEQKTKEAILLKLFDMRQFVPQPFFIIDDFCAGGIVQEDGAAEDHRHFVLFQLPRSKAGKE